MSVDLVGIYETLVYFPFLLQDYEHYEGLENAAGGALLYLIYIVKSLTVDDITIIILWYSAATAVFKSPS